jgi:hypothetical protein
MFRGMAASILSISPALSIAHSATLYFLPVAVIAASSEKV